MGHVFIYFYLTNSNVYILISNDAICHNIGTLRADRQKKRS